MGIDLSTLVTRRHPPGHEYGLDIRAEIEPLAPTFEARTCSSLLSDPARAGEDTARTANRRWAAGFPARARGGQILSGENAFGTRVSPVNIPEAIRGRMVAVSI